MWFKIRLFMVSLIPLFVIIIIQKISIFDVKGQFVGWDKFFGVNIPSVVAIALIFLGLIFFKTFQYTISGGLRNPITIESLDNINYEHLTFITTYIIPLIGFNVGETRHAIVVLFLLITIGAIYIKTNLFYANPTLALFGFHLYKVATKDKTNLIFISQDRLEVRNQVHHKELGANVYFVKKKLQSNNG